ncbi:FecR family protein [uncultured Croceitalea sp.]|uniref:FecR family protein n=1 Tax=uncultured Croceitalea sp. TaxID=1798908 RepID=UPI00374F0F57
MLKSDFFDLVDKFLSDTISEDEKKVLEELLLDKKNAIIFKNLIKEDYLIKTNSIKFDAQKSLDDSLLKLKGVPPQKRNYPTLLKYAAVTLVLIGMALVYRTLSTTPDTTFIMPSQVAEKQIRLLLEDGTEKLLSTTITDSVHGQSNHVLGYVNKGKLQYIKQTGDNKLAYNILKVPHGKQFQVVLSDGTLVHINAGSSLKYPVSFSENGNREVFLDGEAFFEVEKDVARKFIVKANVLNVEVLGTQFNVSSYSEDFLVQTTLEEGSVKVYDKQSPEKALFLEPNEQSSFDKENKSLKKGKVDINQFTAWRQGSLVFKKTAFSKIIKMLERHYDVKIINKNKSLDNETFTARFDEEEIAEIINYFSNSYGFKFNINNQTIEIE